MSTLQESLPGDPTYMLSALQNSNLNAKKQLGVRSVLEDCLKAHIDNAHPSIAMVVRGLQRKAIPGEVNPSTTIKNVFAVMYSPTKTPIATAVVQPPAAAENLADRMENAADGTPGARVQQIDQGGAALLVAPTPTVYDSGMKQLIDQSKFGAAFGGVMPFLNSIIDCQSVRFKSHIEALRDRHPINIAIESCDIPAFRIELEKIFDKTFPREDRRRCLIKEIVEISYDENSMSLLDLRTIMFDIARRIDDLFGGNELIFHKDSMTSQLRDQIMRVIELIKKDSLRNSIDHHFIGKDISELTIDLIAFALDKADDTLRRRDPSYPPNPSSIPAHNAMPGKAPGKDRGRAPNTYTGPPCAACKAIWGYNNALHSLEACYSNPANAAERGETLKIRQERHVKKYGKQPGTFDWPKKRSADPSTEANPMKRGGGGGGSAGGGMRI